MPVLKHGTHLPETMPTHVREILSIMAENQCFDAVLMRRRTYTVGLKEGITSPYPHLKQYIVSRSLKESPDPAVELVLSDATLAVSAKQRALVQTLKQQPGKDLWLCGGGDLAAQLFPAIDELILKVHPILLGSGIQLFASQIQQTALKLVNHQIYTNGFMLLHYQIQH